MSYAGHVLKNQVVIRVIEISLISVIIPSDYLIPLGVSRPIRVTYFEPPFIRLTAFELVYAGDFRTL